MTEFMHEVVARREVTMRRTPINSIDTGIPELTDMMRQAYENMIAQEMNTARLQRRERAIREAILQGSSSVSYTTGTTNADGFINMETVFITDEMREQYANVSVSMR